MNKRRKRKLKERTDREAQGLLDEWRDKQMNDDGRREVVRQMIKWHRERFRELTRLWRDRRGTPAKPRKSAAKAAVEAQRRRTAAERAVKRGIADSTERDAIYRRHPVLEQRPWVPIQNLRRAAARLIRTPLGENQ